jgi:phosphatidylinositol-3-phosphatase
MRGWLSTVTAALLAACTTLPVATAAPALPTPSHIVIVIEENKPNGSIIGNKAAPYINSLANGGANMTQSFAETHPSEPNYLALFSGNTFGLSSDACPVDGGNAPNLASELIAAGYSFGGFAEDLPAVGSTACSAGKYARKHAPWVNFSNVPPAVSVPFSSFNARSDFSSLPTVSFVIPNLDNDMHDGTVAQADSWLYGNLSHYANWAVSNNSLFILTFDEDDGGSKNQIATIIYGAHVKPGSYSEAISHYNVLSTIEEMYGLPKTGLAANAPAITDIWA